MTYPTDDCPVRLALETLAGKWTLLLVHELRGGERLRFAAIRRAVGGISEKMLTQELRRLEAAGLVDRHDYREVPPRVDYALTGRGRGALLVVAALAKFGLELSGRAGSAPPEDQLSTGRTASRSPLGVA